MLHIYQQTLADYALYSTCSTSTFFYGYSIWTLLKKQVFNFRRGTTLRLPVSICQTFPLLPFSIRNRQSHTHNKTHQLFDNSSLSNLSSLHPNVIFFSFIYSERMIIISGGKKNKTSNDCVRHTTDLKNIRVYYITCTKMFKKKGVGGWVSKTAQ